MNLPRTLTATQRGSLNNYSEKEFLAAILGATNPRATGQPREIAGTGAFVQLASVACSSVVFNNTSGVDFDIRRGSTGTVLLRIPDGAGKEFDVVANANELYAKGASGSLQYECNGEEV